LLLIMCSTKFNV